MKLAVLTGLGFYLSLLTAEVFTQEEEFKCPAFTKLTDKIHLFPDPTQCDKYFECRNGLSKRVICQDGLVFHPEKPEGEDPCDLKHNTPDKCKTRPELQRPKPGDSHCPRQNGVYPSEDPFECDVFYSCLNGVGSPTRCAEGLHFSEDIGTCVWARESGRAGCVSEQNRSQKKMTDKKPADDTPTTQKPKSLENGFTCPGGALGVHPALPHPTSCRQYYICLDGITATEAGCTKGRVFNPGTQQCDSPQNVPGCED
ncbi:protein obstructor-E [Eurytemora carolleeae]|uniref:protein obstructor-E n=1 Tax=Eurytemora carolleeae TaxID=1294199 RepID=UPI000C7566B0|nr:protein obstructor-E [Eurytemora carolleeae]|eukprot:XP_023320463.1 protein obstructor-E-like [Eurytemora affinis]